MPHVLSTPDVIDNYILGMTHKRVCIIMVVSCGCCACGGKAAGTYHCIFSKSNPCQSIHCTNSSTIYSVCRDGQITLPLVTCCGAAIGCQVFGPVPEVAHTCSMPASVPATTYTASACWSGSVRACCHGMALCLSSMLVWLTDVGCSPARLPATCDCTQH